ncbi:MAG: hypothetical protein C4542_08885 [Dehalococcoidia bacterium]|nr:MAG: hypothetical protein C4542_08885 [Dehalococcoidia bacterium]
MPLEQEIDNFVKYLGNLGYADSTRIGYEQDLRAFVRFVEKSNDGQRPNLSPENVEAFINRPDQHGKPPSPAYRNRRLSCLRSFFRYLVERQLLDENMNPTRLVRFARLAQTEPSALIYSEYVRIIQTIRQSEAGWLKRRDLAVVATLYNTGIRLSELTALNVEQFDQEGARFVALARKGGQVKDLPVNQNVVWALSSWLNVHPLFGSDPRCPLFVSRLKRRLSGRTVEQLVAKYAKQTGLRKPVTPHTFRHSHCTEIQRRGAEIKTAQAAMGHRRVETTMRYSHSQEADIRAAIAKLDDPSLWYEDADD